jgi:sugar phosphate isomerase/epimerase
MLGASASAIFAQSVHAETTAPPSRRLRVGCSARSLHKLLPTKDQRGEMTVAEFIRQAASWQCDCIELLDTCLVATDNKSLFELKREAFLNAVELSAVSVYTDFIQPDKQKRVKEIERIQGWIDHAAKLGAPVLIVFPGSAKLDVKLDRSIELVAGALRALAGYAADRGVVIAIENHGMFVANADAVLAVAEQVNHPWVGINLDTGNFRAKPYENIARLAAKAVNCHIKLELGKGKTREPADLAKTIATLREANYRGRVVLQYELAGNPREEVPKYLAQLRALTAA